ncbi:MAG: hypothetical protein M9958_11180 [Chitinophagales bacterium]|nr:hypothetical protein [Chitinophagales bacterium]
MKKHYFWVGLLSISILVFFSCKNTNDVSSNESNTTNENTKVTPNIFQVSISGMTYMPDTVTATIGDTVIFTNNDIVPHNVTEINNHWASPTLNPGDTWKTVVDSSSDYYCSLHLVMKGRISAK